MHTIIEEVSPRTVRKRSSKKSSAAVLATCPVNGAGWCPYPFSPAQLERRLRRKREEALTETPKEIKSKRAK
jgi:hypothetical protein